MVENIKYPIIENPQYVDRLFGEIQKELIDNIGWLDVAYGRAERLVAMRDKKRIYTPNVYAGGKEYIKVTPDEHIGNFAFFWVEDPQTLDYEPRGPIAFEMEFSLIVWFDYRKVMNAKTGRNRDEVKRQILDVLNRMTLKSGRVKFERVYELAENIYKGFTLDEVDAQFLMAPFGGFRFAGKLQTLPVCD